MGDAQQQVRARTRQPTPKGSLLAPGGRPDLAKAPLARQCARHSSSSPARASRQQAEEAVVYPRPQEEFRYLLRPTQSAPKALLLYSDREGQVLDHPLGRFREWRQRDRKS